MSNQNAKHIFAQLPQIALDHPDLTPTDMVVLSVLYVVLKDKKYAYHRNKTLAAKAHISERNVARTLNKLERLGFIIRQGLSFTRKFLLGAMFKLSTALYTKVKQVKKNLPTYAKYTPKVRQGGIHTKSDPTNINTEISLEDISLINWYKSHPKVAVPKRFKHFFE